MLAHSSESVSSDSEGDASKVETQKRKHRVHAYFRKNQKISILRTEKYGDLTTAEHKILNEGRESRNNHRYAVVLQFSPLSVIRVKPKLHRRRRRIYESSESRHRSQKLFIRTITFFGKYFEELSWNHRTNYTSSIRDKRNCRMSCTSNKRRDISRIIAFWIG